MPHYLIQYSYYIEYKVLKKKIKETRLTVISQLNNNSQLKKKIEGIQ